MYDGIVVLLVFLCSYAFRIFLLEGGHIFQMFGRVSWLVFPGVFFHLVSFYIFGLYEKDVAANQKYLFIKVFISIVVATGAISIFSFVFPTYQIGRVLVTTHVFFMILVVYLWRRIYGIRGGQGERNHVVLIGWSGITRKIIQTLSQMEDYCIDSVVIEQKIEELNPAEHSFPVYRSLEQALRAKKPNMLIFVKKPADLSKVRNLVLDLRFDGVDILSGVQFYERITGRVPVSNVPEKWLLMAGSESAFQPAIYPHLKRVLDVSLSLLALAVSAPLQLIIAVLIKLDSRGPVFFKQERVGQNEKPFVLLKFRTMVDNAEKDCGPRWACKNDPRVTRIGSILRKTHLDEFPQFFNVLGGHMSLVGPRPFRKVFTDRLAEKFPYYRLRFKVKPGLSGWAQVNMAKGNTEEGQYEKLEYEIYYIYHQSIFLDLFVILKTLQSMLRMRSA